jgi:Fe-S-cluster containining protein
LKSPLTFRCTSCGNCCRTLRVAVTSFDVLRLAQLTGRPATDLVQWLSPRAVDMEGEPQGFVELSAGRQLMVLAQERGACKLLGEDERCTAYAARPLDCQAFPFDLARDVDGSGKRRLQLLPLEGCDHADDGTPSRADIERTDAARLDELTRYHALVARWNRRALHHRRLGHPVGGAAAFLGFVLAPALAADRSLEGP